MKVSTNAPNLRPFYLLLVGVGGIAAHLVSEFAAMGSDAKPILFSPRHWYLGAAVLTGIVVFILQAHALCSQAANGRDFKRMLHNGLATLPMHGRGAAFAMLTAGLQFAVGMSTEIGEGAPIAGHDVIAGVFGAILLVLAMALATKAIARSLPRIVEAIVGLSLSPNGPTDATVARARAWSPVIRPTFLPSLYNRPPPASSLS
jgi:hypothetical protein